VPYWVLFFLAEFFFLLVRDLTLLATWNSGIDLIRELYVSAASELLTVGTPSARRHAELLRAFAAEDLRGRFMGFRVYFLIVRTVTVTCFTLSVGLYSIFRGIGISFVPSTVCLS